MESDENKPKMFKEASELDERRVWAKLDITYPDGEQEHVECSMIRGFLVKKNDPNRVMAFATGYAPPGADMAMLQLLPGIIPTILKGEQNGTDTE